MVNSIFVRQIYYDKVSLGGLDAKFIPLSNVDGPRDWYEFFPILDYLRKHTLEPDAWYGFLSPRFTLKTGISSDSLFKVLTENSSQEVVLISPHWDQLAYFRNVFEQGDFRHPGLMDASQSFLNASGRKFDLATLVTHSLTSVFSNYVIAKRKYWLAWLEIAQDFYDYCNSNELGKTSYLDAPMGFAPMKTFIQERLSSIVLSTRSFKTIAVDFSFNGKIFDGLFNADSLTRKRLIACDLMKQSYCVTGDTPYLEAYYKVRNAIILKGSASASNIINVFA